MQYNMTEGQQNSILIVDDETLNISALTHILSPLYTIYVTKDGHSVVKTAKNLKPDVILLDVIMPEISGFEVIKELKEDDETSSIPVIFVTGLTQKADEEHGLTLGASDYIHKPFNASIVKLRVQNQMHIVNQMRMIQHLSMTDVLTNTSNRRHFNTRLNQEWNRAKRDGTNVSLLLLDVDDFKDINDRYGHLIGDIVLREIAENIKQCLKRSMDLVARWGGEEFAVLLPNTPVIGAEVVAEKIRYAIENHSYQSDDLEGVVVTISIGLNCIFPSKSSSVQDFINGADKALYQAKEYGKNQICIAS